mgnify:CR=1 FL=1
MPVYPGPARISSAPSVHAKRAQLDNLEKALRNALAKGEARDPAFREKVYAAAHSAMVKVASNASGTDPALAERRRRALIATMTRIEEEYYRAPVAELARETVPAPVRQADAGEQQLQHASGGRAMEPQSRAADVRPEAELLQPDDAVRFRPDNAPFDAEQHARPDISPTLEQARSNVTGDAGHGKPSPGISLFVRRRRAKAPKRDKVESRGEVTAERGRKNRRHPFALTLSAAVLIAAIGIGAWWVWSTGAYRGADERDTGVPNPPATLNEEPFGPDPGSEDFGGASRVFSPDAWTGVAPLGDSTADLVSDAGASVLRIEGRSAGGGVEIEVPEGILLQLYGGAAIFSVTAKAVEGDAQVVVTCDLGGLDCGRRRFTLADTPSDQIFEVDMSDGAPKATGVLRIEPVLDDGRPARFDLLSIAVKSSAL